MANVGDRLFNVGKYPFGILDELGPGLGKADLPGCSEKQPGTKFMFQSRNPFRKSGLAKSQTFACASKVKFFRHGDEAFQLSDVQYVLLCGST